MRVNSQYNVASADSLPARIAHHQRRKMFLQFLSQAAPESPDTIIDVGVTSDEEYDHSNYFELWYPHKSRITAVGLDDASFLETRFPGVKYVFGDGCALPFGDNSFDYAHSSAVIEHVGSRERQTLFLSELWRVARKGIFVTTPNRWFPIEFHTVLPLLHWLPAAHYRAVLRRAGRGFFAQEENLNLLSSRSFMECARQAQIVHPRMATVALAGWTTNLLLVASKSGKPPMES